MPPALKHLDPIVGVDIHLIQLPAPGPPVPIPHPYVGMILDVTDYIPFLGATVKINGLPRAKAGTSGQALPPHIPMGGTFIKPPTNESETFLGSATVAADGDPLVYAGLPILTCQDIGIPAQPRAGKQNEPKSLMLPTGQAIPIPAGPLVMVGGPPSFLAALKGTLQKLALSMAAKKLAALAMKSKRLGALAAKIERGLERASELAHEALDKVLGKLGLGKTTGLRNALSRAICSLTGHPVDVATGKVLTEQVDFELPGAIPLRWERVWYSTSIYRGPLGYGWHHPYDAALMLVGTDAVAVRLSDGRGVVFLAVQEGEEQFDRKEKLTLFRDERGYGLRDASGVVQRFGVAGPPGEPLRLVAVEDASQNRIRFDYDERGRLARIVDSGGRELAVRSDDQGRITEIWGPHPTHAGQSARLASYAYDEAGNLVTWWDALGHAMQLAYRGHLLERETNRNGLSFYFEYDGTDENARCVRTWGDGGIYDHKLTYDEGRTVVVNSLGHATTYFHRGGAVYKTVDARGGVTETERNRWAELEREVDPLGAATVTTRDARGNPIDVTKADGAKLSIEYGERDRPESVHDELGGVWSWQYDEAGRVVTRTDPMGRVTRLQWSHGRLVSMIDPAGLTTSLGYSAAGQIASVRLPDGTEWRWQYDRLGRVVAAVDAKGNVQRREHDLAGRVVRVVEADGNVRDLAHDQEGNVTRARDRQYDVSFAYRGMNRLAERTQAGTSVRFEYDTEEQLVGVLNEHGYAYRFVHDETGQVSEEIAFDGVSRSYARDLAGRVVRVQRASGRATTYRYDPLGRVLLTEHSDQTAEWYAYRADGALREAGNTTTRVAFERDALGRVVKETQGEDWVESAFDERGLRASVRSSKGAHIAIERNAVGEVLALRAAEGGAVISPEARASKEPAPAFEAKFVRDSLGLELERTLPGGVRARWERDKTGRPVRHEVFSGATWKAEWHYTWDVNDRLQNVLDAARGPVRYRHDAVGNLAAVIYEDGHVDLRMPDAVGNLFRSEKRDDRTYGAAGQLLEARGPEGVTRYGYDGDGNLIEKVEPDNRAWRYEWNAAGMLARVVRPDGWVVEFGYDVLGRRTFKKFRGKVTRWVWDGNVPLHEWTEKEVSPPRRVQAPPAQTAEADEIASTQRDIALVTQPAQGPPEGTAEAPITWLFEPESFSPLGKLVGGQRFGIVTDHLGTPVQMFDEDGREAWSASVDGYGGLRHVRGESQACPFRWPGQYEDEETGLYYNRFRYYDPRTGTYPNTDPIGLRGGTHTYAYVRNPLRWIDPLGLASCTKYGPHVPAGEAGAASRAIVPYYPADNGFLRTTTPTVLQPRQVIDRVGGSAASRFFSPVGTPLAARALPPGTTGALRTFEVLKPIDAQSGTVAPAFGQLGLGTQFRTASTLEDLLNGDFLREVTP
ncbi:MAG: DUF6531 domain-containing protein [Myxococcota bacterium]|nr:DUF6531 domain-containing protein [Myxococcota bacterium]